MQPIITFLWFDDEAEEAANYYVSVFPDSRVTRVTHYLEASVQASGKPAAPRRGSGSRPRPRSWFPATTRPRSIASGRRSPPTPVLSSAAGAATATA